MAKKVQLGENIYIAPDITGKKYDNGELDICDNLTGDKLFPESKIEDKIRIYERQVKEWFLERAGALIKKEKNSFIILMIATAYIEGVEQYRLGKSSNGRSGSFFKKGIKRIFKIDSLYDNRLSDLYKELRCELFHNGMTGPYLRIYSGYDLPIDLSENKLIKINQILFLEKIKRDFESYLVDLKNTEQKKLRKNFDKMYVLK